MEPPNPSQRFRAHCTECWLDPNIPSPGRGRRALAGLLDSALALTLASSILLVRPAVATLLPMSTQVAAVFLGAALFLALMESLHGGGPAKTLLGMRVMDARGDRRLSLGRALGRSIAILLGAGILPAYASSRCMSLSDQWADSNVFSVRALPRDLRSSPQHFQRAFAIAIVAAVTPTLCVLLASS